MAKKYKPFSFDSQSKEWTDGNCGTCKKGFDPRRKSRCDYELALAAAYCGDGQITEDEARAIGFLENKDCTIWECPGWARRRG